MSNKTAIVIGAGIVGLATARALATHGYSVKVFERNQQAVGASIRNFGMVWPVGQPLGPLRERALRSRELWLEACTGAGIWHNPCGSLLNVYHTDELSVIEEFYADNKNQHPCAILTPAETISKSAATNPAGLKAALWSSTEVIVDPREAIAKLPAWLHQRYGVAFYFNTAIARIEGNKVYSGKQTWQADVIVVCSGADFETLYPEHFAATAITKCKLQMLRTIPQPGNWNSGPALSAGLTLTHYGAFAHCASLPALQQRYNQQYPEHIKWGIHVMISQNGLGEVTIGDSHEYGLVHDPFDREEINRLILDYLQTFTQLPAPAIAQTWNGTYAKLKGASEIILQPENGVYIINALSGAGMTLSFGLAEEQVNSWLR